MKNTVSALFVDPTGPYTSISGVDPWDENRDARGYSGGLPVVAHPPCGRWGKLAPINLKRWGTPIGEDGGCFLSALNSVRKWGGVLEHPAQTLAWRAHNLKKPTKGGWMSSGFGEWVGEVWQSDYGHRATKKTWLLYVGVFEPAPYRSLYTVGSHQVGGGVNTGHNKKPRLPQKDAHLTPPEFARYLVDLAANSGGAPDCLCAFCRNKIGVGEPVSDNPVYKCGELSYIELAHTRCATMRINQIEGKDVL